MMIKYLIIYLYTHGYRQCLYPIQLTNVDRERCVEGRERCVEVSK